MRPAPAAAFLGLLLVAGPATAVTCAQDTVPAATLLVPYFRVSRNGAAGGDPIPAEGANTLLAITNTASIGVIAHLTVFNKYGGSVLDLNVPLQGHDVVFFDMRQILNGDFNLNPNLQGPNQPDVCSSGLAGFGPTLYRRFENPDPEDRSRATSTYGALSRAQLSLLRDSLDESGDVTSLLSAKGPNLLDADSPACGSPSDGRLFGDFSGYLTVDVVNYCTTRGPADRGGRYFVDDAIATTGWAWDVDGESGDSPNTLMGDVFSVDAGASGTVISGDPMVAVEVDRRLLASSGACRSAQDGEKVCRTFYGRYLVGSPAGSDPAETPASVPEAFRGAGDGREPLAERYGFRYLNDEAHGLRSWLTVWQTDSWLALSNAPVRVPSLCDWARDCLGSDINQCRGWGTWEARLATDPSASRFDIHDNDGALYVTPPPNGCGICTVPPAANVYLESQRIQLVRNADVGLNDPRFTGGWIDLTLRGSTGLHQAWVGVQHAAPGQLISVGHEATVLSKPFECVPALFQAPALGAP